MKACGVKCYLKSCGLVLALLGWSGCSQKVSAPEPVIFLGTLAVYTVPAGAAIYLNGSNTGLVTPDTIPDLTPGAYSLTLKMANFHDTTLSVQVSSNIITFVKVNMLSRYGTFIILSNPSGADIYSKNLFLGITPETLTYVIPDTYQFVLKLPGYIDYVITAGIVDGQVKTLYCDWNTLGYGTLLVTSTPSGARLNLDHFKNVALTPAKLEKILAGYHTLEFNLSGHLASKIDTFLPGGRVLSLHDSLKPVTIQVNSTPSAAKLYVDGSYYGQTPYTLKGVIDQGLHQLRLAKLGTEEYAQNIYLADGDTLDINLFVLFEVLFYDDFNRPASQIAGDWSIYEDRWQEWPKGDKEPDQAAAYCLALPENAPTCGYVYQRDSLLIGQVSACTLFIHQYDNSGYLSALANGELLPGIGTLPNGTSRASLDKFVGQKIQLSFYGCPAVYIDSLLVAGYK